MRNRSVDVFASVFESDGEPAESVAIDVGVSLFRPTGGETIIGIHQ